MQLSENTDILHKVQAKIKKAGIACNYTRVQALLDCSFILQYMPRSIAIRFLSLLQCVQLPETQGTNVLASQIYTSTIQEIIQEIL